MRRPATQPAVRSSRRAVSPASGSAAACTAVTEPGRTARAPAGTATNSAQPADDGWPTTRCPTWGPEPSGAAWTTSPAMSLPGRAPSADSSSRKISPRFTEYASTFTSASSGRCTGSPTSARRTVPAPSPVATNAFITPTSCRPSVRCPVVPLSAVRCPLFPPVRPGR